jgi:hypothetical protein
VSTSTNERRRYGRIRLDDPLKGRFGDDPVRVAELSISGALISHEGKFPQGETRPLLVQYEREVMEMDCSVTRTTLQRLAKNLGDRSIYQSGLRIVGFAGDGFHRLRRVLSDRILRALEEQKANARGIPPLNAYMYQPGKGELLRRCELVEGEWRKSETIRRQQPPNGFTISAEVDPEHVKMLCETWEHTTPEGRRLTQLFAELSISSAEGIPTRRYVP